MFAYLFSMRFKAFEKKNRVGCSHTVFQKTLVKVKKFINPHWIKNRFNFLITSTEPIFSGKKKDRFRKIIGRNNFKFWRNFELKKIFSTLMLKHLTCTLSVPIFALRR